MGDENRFLPEWVAQAMKDADRRFAESEQRWAEFAARTETLTGPIIFPIITGDNL